MLIPIPTVFPLIRKPQDFKHELISNNFITRIGNGITEMPSIEFYSTTDRLNNQIIFISIGNTLFCHLKYLYLTPIPILDSIHNFRNINFQIGF